jgi:hypothetical protein
MFGWLSTAGDGTVLPPRIRSAPRTPSGCCCGNRAAVGPYAGQVGTKRLTRHEGKTPRPSQLTHMSWSTSPKHEAADRAPQRRRAYVVHPLIDVAAVGEPTVDERPRSSDLQHDRLPCVRGACSRHELRTTQLLGLAENRLHKNPSARTARRTEGEQLP